MKKFEVLIPGHKSQDKSQVFLIDADNWMKALKDALSKVGEQGDIMSHILCDVKPDGSKHVTDTKSGRVFKLHDITNSAPNYSGNNAKPLPPKTDIGRQVEEVSLEEVMFDIFDRAAEVYSSGYNQEEGIKFMLELAMEYIDSESGSILLADINEQELFFGAAIGPKSEEVKKFRVPMGVGVVGWCAVEGINMAISDAKHDPRFFKEISDKLGYDTESLLCAAMQTDEGRNFGCIELINKADNVSYSEKDMAIISYLAKKTAEYLATTL